MSLKVRNIIENNVRSEKIIALDVGAKGGVFQLPKLTKYTNYIGFEPNPTETDKIRSYEDAEYLPYALSRSTGNREIRITKHNSYSSFFEFDEGNFRKHFHLMKEYNRWKSGFKLEKLLAVPTKSLDDFMCEKAMNIIDFIKLDTQGSELEILQGGINAITKNRIGVIFCEVNFVKIYHDQNLFSDLDLFLRSHNYEFIDCRYYPESVYQIKIPFSKKVYDRPKYSVGGDAVFVPNIDIVTLDKTSYFKIGLILASLGYFGIAHNFFEKSNLLTKEILLLLKYFDSFQLKQLLENYTPPIISNIIQKLK